MQIFAVAIGGATTRNERRLLKAIRVRSLEYETKGAHQTAAVPKMVKQNGLQTPGLCDIGSDSALTQERHWELAPWLLLVRRLRWTLTMLQPRRSWLPRLKLSPGPHRSRKRDDAARSVQTSSSGTTPVRSRIRRT